MVKSQHQELLPLQVAARNLHQEPTPGTYITPSGGQEPTPRSRPALPTKASPTAAPAMPTLAPGATCKDAYGEFIDCTIVNIVCCSMCDHSTPGIISGEQCDEFEEWYEGNIDCYTDEAREQCNAQLDSLRTARIVAFKSHFQLL
jgi:hypothetical protein